MLLKNLKFHGDISELICPQTFTVKRNRNNIEKEFFITQYGINN